MSANAYKQQLETFRSDLRRMEKERAAMNAKFDEDISYLKKVIENLTPLAQERTNKPPIDINALGLDEAIIEIISEDKTNNFPPKQILKRLLDRGFDFGAYSNRMAYLHAALKRLSRKQRLHRNHIPDVGSTYRWKTPVSEPLSFEAKLAEFGKKA